MNYTLSLLVLALGLQTEAACAQRHINPAIALVEKSLVGPTHVNGFKGWTMQERMTYYHVNGVSIAVIRNYKVEWAKGYGWADKAKGLPTTANTRFQAGSISKSL